jgi:hypothetical protein
MNVFDILNNVPRRIFDILSFNVLLNKEISELKGSILTLEDIISEHETDNMERSLYNLSIQDSIEKYTTIKNKIDETKKNMITSSLTDMPSIEMYLQRLESELPSIKYEEKVIYDLTKKNKKLNKLKERLCLLMQLTNDNESDSE